MIETMNQLKYQHETVKFEYVIVLDMDAAVYPNRIPVRYNCVNGYRDTELSSQCFDDDDGIIEHTTFNKLAPVDMTRYKEDYEKIDFIEKKVLTEINTKEEYNGKIYHLQRK
jgi:hypothetical protein